MGRHPSNGAPSFRFNSAEVAQMEAILQRHEGHVPPRDLLVALANRFSNSPERAGKVVIQMKQVWNWFQNRRYALRAKLIKSPERTGPSPFTRDNVTPLRSAPPVPQQMLVTSGPNVVRYASENPHMEFEARSARDGAWYDVQAFLSHRYLESGNPEVLVRFAGFGPEEDEWLDIRKHVRQRSLPCETSECIVVIPGDLILCFQEGKEQALYFDAHVLDAQRRRHDVRGCRCRFLVRYDHDQSEEIVPLRKICRRPETDYRLQQLHAEAASASVSAEPPNPVVDLTASRMANLGADSAVVANNSPPSMGAEHFTPAEASAATLVPSPPPVMAPSPTLLPVSVPTLVAAPASSTSVSVSAPVASTPVAAVAPSPVTQPVAPVMQAVIPAPVTEPVAAALVIEPVAPVVVNVPVATAEVGESMKIKSDNPVTVPEPRQVDSVNPGMSVVKVTLQENVMNPATTSIAPDAKQTEGSVPETVALTGTGGLSGIPTMTFPEPNKVKTTIPGGDYLVDATLGEEGRTKTASTGDGTGNVALKTEDVKE